MNNSNKQSDKIKNIIEKGGILLQGTTREGGFLNFLRFLNQQIHKQQKYNKYL